MANSLLFGSKARQEIATGIKTLSDAVRVTLGPRGRNVIIEQDFGTPLIINDGVTIAKNIQLKNKYQNLGASLIIEAANKTNDYAGDGTTTAIILAAECVLNGLKLVDKGVNPVDIKEGFEFYLPLIIEEIKSVAQKITLIDDLRQVATLSSANVNVGNLIAEAYMEVGADGIVSVDEAQGIDTYLDIVKGYSYDRGYASSYMANNEEKQIAELSEPNILVTDKKIQSMKEIMPYLENAMKIGKPLLIICDDIEQEILSTIVMNKLRGVFNVVVTKAPSFGDRKIQLLKDIACVTGATFISTTKGDDLATEDIRGLGSANKVIVSQNSTVIIDGHGDENAVTEYVLGLKTLYDQTNNDYDKEKYRERIAKIVSGIAVIKVGAATEVELHDKKLRIEDALCATKAAMQSGIIEGGGKVLFQIAEKLETNQAYPESKAIIINALKTPFYQILTNAGVNVNDVENKLSNELWFDAKTKQVVNLKQSGIVDPASVEIAAITNALSIAGIVLTTECAIILQNKEQTVDEDNLL